MVPSLVAAGAAEMVEPRGTHAEEIPESLESWEEELAELGKGQEQELAKAELAKLWSKHMELKVFVLPARWDR